MVQRAGVSLAILRVPGIYAADRLPLERLRAGTPVLRAEDDVYTNHIHADDLAAIVGARARRTAPGGIYNASDDSEMRMGDWFDLVADAPGLPRPPRIARAEATGRIAPAAAFVHERIAAPRQPAHEGASSACGCATRPSTTACRASRGPHERCSW